MINKADWLGTSLETVWLQQIFFSRFSILFKAPLRLLSRDIREYTILPTNCWFISSRYFRTENPYAFHLVYKALYRAGRF